MFVPPSPLPPTPSGFFPHKSVGSSLAKVTMTRGAQRRVCLLARPASSPGCLLHSALRQHSALSLPPCPVLPSAQPWDAGQRGGPGLRPPPPSAPRWETLPAHGLLSPFFVLRSRRPETGIILDLPSAGDQPASTSRHLSLQPGPDSSPSPLSPPLLLLVGTFPQPPRYLRFHRLPL